MTRQEVLQALRASREVNTIDDTKNWRDAFELYNKAQGTTMIPSGFCQKCFTKVLEWLQKD